MKLKYIYEQIVKELDSPHGFGVDLLPRVEKALNVKAVKFYKSGTRSDVFDIGSGKVLKLTDDPQDASGFMLGKSNPTYPIPKVYAIYKLQGWGVPRNCWVIVSEKVKTGNFNYSDEMEMRQWFYDHTNYYPNDTHPGNLGMSNAGKLVYLDPSFDNADEYLNKIPKLKI